MSAFAVKLTSSPKLKLCYGVARQKLATLFIFWTKMYASEVLQIFVCICGNIPVMRTPLQILFLILVTDLPPSIALGARHFTSRERKMWRRGWKPGGSVPRSSFSFLDAARASTAVMLCISAGPFAHL